MKKGDIVTFEYWDNLFKCDAGGKGEVVGNFWGKLWDIRPIGCSRLISNVRVHEDYIKLDYEGVAI